MLFLKFLKTGLDQNKKERLDSDSSAGEDESWIKDLDRAGYYYYYQG